MNKKSNINLENLKYDRKLLKNRRVQAVLVNKDR
jgi:hypothetical protein